VSLEQPPKRVMFEMLNVYANQALKTEVIGLTTGLLMAFFFWNERTQHYLFFWLMVLISGPLIHHIVIYQFQQNKTNVFQTLNLLKGFWFGSGCLWGVFVLICLNTEETLNIAILTGLVVGMLVGAIPGASMLHHVYMFFSIPFCLLYSFAMFNDAADVNIMGVLGFIMLGLVLMLSSQLHIEFRRSIHLRFEKDALLENLQQQKEAAEKATKDKTHFLAAASHDLRQPHQALGLFVEALDHMETDVKKKEILSKTKQAFQAMSALLDQLLDISKLDNANITADKQAVALQPLLHQVVMEHMGEAEEKGIELRLRATQAVALVDPAMLNRIISNLLTNAIHYTQQGGVLLAVRKRQGKLLVDVWDTGHGIAKDKQAYIFKEFTQLENPERDREKGLGLGLAIVQRLVKILGAKIEVTSKLQQGTRFSLYLESTQAELVLPKVEVNLNVAVLHGLHVVVIDDDKIALESMDTLLAVWGCTSKTFASEQEALTALAASSYRPDVLIVDYRLRDKQSGVDAITSIRAHFKQDIPALIITGDTAPERITEAKTSGLPLLHKPVDPNALKRFLIQTQ